MKGDFARGFAILTLPHRPVSGLFITMLSTLVAWVVGCHQRRDVKVRQIDKFLGGIEEQANETVHVLEHEDD